MSSILKIKDENGNWIPIPAIKGEPGSNGTSVTVKSVSESTADGGSNVVTFSDGKTVTVKNGKTGSNGKDGYTPQRGVDYWTETDKAEIVATVLESIGCPVFGIVDENNTVMLSGMLPDGTYNIKYEMEDGSIVDIGNLALVAEPTYTNLATTVTTGYRLNSSGATTAQSGTTVVEDYIQFAAGTVVRVKGLTLGTSNVAFYDSNKTCLTSGSHTYPGTNSSKTIEWEKETNEIYKYTNVSNTCAFVRFSGTLVGTPSDVVITVNEPIV